jgi:hypothetical protein
MKEKMMRRKIYSTNKREEKKTIGEKATATMEEKKMMVEEKKKKEQKRRRRKKRRKKWFGFIPKRPKQTHPQLVCIDGCWFTQAKSLSQVQHIWACGVSVNQFGTDFYYLPNTGVCKINGVSLLTAKLPLFHSRAC